MNDPDTIAPGCVCGRCTAVCKHRPFVPCCGACHFGGPFSPPATGPNSPADFWAGYIERHPEEADA